MWFCSAIVSWSWPPLAGVGDEGDDVEVMVWSKQGKFFFYGSSYPLATGSKATTSLIAHEPVSADLVMVAFAATEGTGGVGPGAVFATMASCSTSKTLASHGLDEVFEGTAVGPCRAGARGVDFHGHGVDLGMSSCRSGNISS